MSLPKLPSSLTRTNRRDSSYVDISPTFLYIAAVRDQERRAFCSHTFGSLPREPRWGGNVRGIGTMQRRRPPSAPPPLIWPNKRHCWAGNRCHHYTPVLSHHARLRPVRHAFLISTCPSAPASRRLPTASHPLLCVLRIDQNS